MQKQIGSVLLIAGTCIGSGMIALPILLSKLGILASIGLMVVIWGITYYSALITVELQLQSGKALNIGELGRYYSGYLVQFIGTASLKLLSYSLLAVYIYGSSSILEKMLGGRFSLEQIAGYCASLTTIILLLPIKFVDYFNRILFICLLLVFAILLLVLTETVNWNNVPLASKNYSDISAWTLIIPVLFTSFGFQGSLHTITSYCDMNLKVLKKAIFWGTMIPAIVYLVWASSTMGVIYNQNPSFYSDMINGKVEVADLIQELTTIAKSHSVQLTVWWISLLAIFTSMLGVGVGLSDSLSALLNSCIKCDTKRGVFSVIASVLPSYVIAVFVPNAFITILGFAGMILAGIAILLPVYLFTRLGAKKLHSPELKIKSLVLLSGAVGVIIVASEIFNMS